jgi:hypothetical protein
MTEPTVDRDPFEVVAESFLARFRAGERPSIEELATRHPELADQVRELLPALVMVEQDLTIDREPGSYGPQPPPAPAPLKERRLGDYRILREIGRGGMGVVYEAEQVSLGRRVALKVLPRHGVGDHKALQRFRREAKAAARLHHTNILPVFEVGRDGDTAFYAMQIIQGQGLDQVIDELGRRGSLERRSHQNDRAGSGRPRAPLPAPKRRIWRRHARETGSLNRWPSRSWLAGWETMGCTHPRPPITHSTRPSGTSIPTRTRPLVT